jgi:DNA-binding PadR family transcriptional regulator
MSSDGNLNLFSYEILGLIGREGAGPHDLRRMVERGRLLAWAGESRYYTEPKRLARLGYLEASKEPGATTERTVYRLTDRAREALREWGRRPAEITPLRSEPMVRLLSADLVGEAATRESLTALREEIDELRQVLKEAEAGAEQLPHRREYLLLAYEFLRGYLDLHAELADKLDDRRAS